MSPKNILVLGEGGREHALLSALARTSTNPDMQLFSCPGSAAHSELATCLSAQSVGEVIDLAKAHAIELIIAGQEAWLVRDQGLADACAQAGIACWGPNKRAAQLEASKAFCKDFLTRHHIPTARAQSVSGYDEALAAIDGYPVVLKFDGLAAGKGVAVCSERSQAENFLHEVFIEQRFGQGSLLVEEALVGPEISIFAAISGPAYEILACARDYKRLKEGDQGPNTGGMGAVSSLDILTADERATIKERIIDPTVAGMEADGLAYRGFLYFGLMLTADGPKVIEYNVRFGDPECQAVMPTLTGDFANYLYLAAQGRLEEAKECSPLSIAALWSVALCAASAGYPESSRSGDVIGGIDALSPEAQLFHAGTQKSATGQWQTAGGRVLAVVAQGKSLQQARESAYAELDKIQFDGKQIRSDIGQLHFE